MPPVADQASLFRGRLPISGYKVSADWLEPTVYPFLGFPRTPFLTVAENLSLYRQPQVIELCTIIQMIERFGDLASARDHSNPQYLGKRVP